MKVLILSSAFSGLTQRVVRELLLLGHQIETHFDLDEILLRQQCAQFNPQIIICPFLTQRIPEDVWKKYRCLVVHPGIEGDRGPSSLDWAISQGKGEWGVTLLQAHAEMDAGDIWGTKNFPMRRAGKTSIYKREVSETAIALIKEALGNEELPGWKPRPLVENAVHVQGTLLPFMRQADRKINWHSDSSAEVLNKLNAADTNPGVIDNINGIDTHLYGAIEEAELRGEPGTILAIHQGSVCRATADGAVWIRQLKCKKHHSLPPIKLPASQVLQQLLPSKELKQLAKQKKCSAANDIWVEREGDTAYLHFNFYNGAMNTQHCLDLKHHLAVLKKSNVKVIVFMGGEDFWSNGIHLNCIEAANDPALESWQNINAIDDLVLEMINTPKQITVAALRNNAGAGGVMMALACDQVIIRDGVVLNPHYNSMGLYGSEYWTYLLPRRVGEQQARIITAACEPMLACEASKLGLADTILPESWDKYHAQLEQNCERLADTSSFKQQLKKKKQQRKADEERRPLVKYRREELAIMREIFYTPDSDYHYLRRAFVYKEKRSIRKNEEVFKQDGFKEVVNP